jgi:hypothetical protein
LRCATRQYFAWRAAEFSAEGAGEAGWVVKADRFTDAADRRRRIHAHQFPIGLAQPALFPPWIWALATAGQVAVLAWVARIVTMPVRRAD